MSIPLTIADKATKSQPSAPEYQRQAPGLRPVSDFTAAVVTSTALGLSVVDPAVLAPTHCVTTTLMFYRPEHGLFLIDTGTLVHAFNGIVAAHFALTAHEVWQNRLADWAFRKNAEKGYLNCWIAGDIRGVHPKHLEQLP